MHGIMYSPFLCISIAAISICSQLQLGSALLFTPWKPCMVGPGAQGEVGSCLSTADEQNQLLQVRTHISLILAGFVTVPQCGDGLWYPVAYLNMNDSTHECPSNWKQINISIRACGRPTSTGVKCTSEYFSTRSLQYNKVCGRVIGYQEGSTDTFK